MISEVPISIQFELWTDTCAPGSNPTAVSSIAATAEQASAVGLKLEAAWATEFGEVGQVLSLWRRSGESVSLSSDSIRPVPFPGSQVPAQISRDKRLLKLESTFDGAFIAGHIYDYRTYTLRPGARDEFIAQMLSALPVRINYSKLVGVWTPMTGNPDQVVHIWAYRNLLEREQARSGVAKEPSWQKYLEHVFPLMLRMQTAFLVPLQLSPMQ